MASFEEVFKFIRNGVTIKQQSEKSGLPITRIETISNRVIDRSRMGYAGITDSSKYQDYILQDGDILMSHINSVQHLGKSALYQKEGNEQIIHGMNLLCLRPTNRISCSYAFHYFSSDAFSRQISNITKPSVNQASFTVSALKKLAFPLRSISEQVNIATRLDKVNGLIELRKQQLSKLDQLVKSRFIEMFWGSFPTIKVGDVFQTTSGGTPSKSHSEYYENGTIPWLTSSEINRGVITSVNNYISELGLKNSSAKMIPSNSVVVAMYGATAGQVGLLKIETSTNQAVCAILPHPQYIAEYLYYAVSQKKDWMVQQCSGGAQPNISQTIIKRMELLSPPLHLQKEFAVFVQKVDKSKSAVKQSLEKLETLKKSLMQEYFG